jgi:putative pyruvate formate lyase activating enzyme
LEHFPEYHNCSLCPRQCGADRSNGSKGSCGRTDRLFISSIGPHFGEEPPISGSRGSGTVFFTGCSTGCFFCQNHQISHQGLGREYSLDAFMESVKRLIGSGVHNVNYVTPDHYWPHVRALIRRLREENIPVPHLINSSGYEQPATVKEMTGLADIFLPDYKFADDSLAEYCTGRGDYRDVALKAIEMMIESRGFLDSSFDDEEVKPATRGVLVRHLVLPGHAGNSIRALEDLRNRFGRYVPVSLMSQYQPTAFCRGKGDFERPVTAEEYKSVFRKARELGFENLFFQTDAGDNDFLPDFEKENPFKGNLLTPLPPSLEREGGDD